MNVSLLTGIIIFLLGCISVIIIALSLIFEKDEQDKILPRSLPKTDPDNPSDIATPG